MSEITSPDYGGVDRRDLRQPGRRATDRARPEGDDPTGRVDVLLYARICGAHAEAEQRYLNSIAHPRAELAQSSRNMIGAELNAKAEGLAEALSILSGYDVFVIRQRVQRGLEERAARQLVGVGRARREL